MGDIVQLLVDSDANVNSQNKVSNARSPCCSTQKIVQLLAPLHAISDCTLHSPIRKLRCGMFLKDWQHRAGIG